MSYEKYHLQRCEHQRRVFSCAVHLQIRNRDRLTVKQMTSSGDLGVEVDPAPANLPDSSVTLRGKYVTLEALEESHMSSLWRNLDPENHAYIFDYLPMAFPTSEAEFWELLRNAMHFGMIIFAIKADPEHLSPGQPDSENTEHREVLGIISYLDIQPLDRALEVGAVIFGPDLARTTAATEVHYLILRNVLEPGSPGLGGDSLPYRRVCWKNNALNTKSRRAAERIGYTYEGTFRNHSIVKRRSRDSNWLSIVEDEWPAVKAALEQWLKPENFEESGKQVRKLKEIREGLKQKAES